MACMRRIYDHRSTKLPLIHLFYSADRAANCRFATPSLFLTHSAASNAIAHLIILEHYLSSLRCDRSAHKWLTSYIADKYELAVFSPPQYCHVSI